MKMRFWGTRGGVASPSAATCELGGNTPCLQVSLSDGRSIIVDCGSGVIEYASTGSDIKSAKEFHFLISHFHWDHIIGFPFFHPIHRPGTKIFVYSPFPASLLEKNMASLFDGTYSPLRSIKNLPAKIEFRQLGDERTQIQGAAVSFCPLSHTTQCFAFRIEEGAVSLVYASDHEKRLGGHNEGLVEFSRGADALIHDAQFFSDEYERFKGWGHSTIEDAIENGIAAGARRVFLTHHNPGRADDYLRLYLHKLKRLKGSSQTNWPEVQFAAEDGKDYCLQK